MVGIAVGMSLSKRPPKRKPRGRHPHHALTPAFIRNVSQAGRYCDGQGLYLDVRPTGSRGWIQRLTIRGRRTEVGLGGFPLVSLKEAREKAFADRKLAREYLVLTATRSGEVRGAVWTEVDRDEGVWTIPAGRTKGNREHRVPLSRSALEIVKEAKVLGRDNRLVFPRVGGKPIGSTAMSELLRRLRIAAVPHGFRSSFRDWATEETDHPREVAEAALAHKVRNPIEAAYRRTDLFERRRRLMDDWASYLAGESRKPVSDRLR